MKTMRIPLLAAAAVLLLTLASCEWNSTVKPNDKKKEKQPLAVPAQYSTIQAAIDAAADSGDVIVVQPGNYNTEGSRNIDFRGKAVTLRSSAGATTTIIDCQGSPRFPARAFIFDNGEDSTTIVDGFTVKGGYESDLDTKYGARGGAVYCEGTWPRIRNCVFQDNDAEYGGAIYCKTAAPFFDSCKFISNVAIDGGAVMIDGSPDGPQFTDCIFKSNAADSRGGAILLQTSSAVIASCEFESNRAPNRGGAIYCQSSSPILTSCLLVGNRSTSSDSEGGAVAAVLNSNPALLNCTLFGNTAKNGGGLSCMTNSSPYVSESIIAFNTGGGAVRSDDVSSQPNLVCTDVYQNTGGDWTDAIEGQDQDPVRKNLFADPDFCDTENGNFGLHADSPCMPDNNSCATQIGAPLNSCPAE
jgi:predicted outer membrane repeat protein